MPLTRTAAPAAPAAPPTAAPIEVIGLAPDFVPYTRGLELQAEAVAQLRSGEGPGVAMLLEHTPVYTAGRRSLPEEYPQDGTPVVPVDRGGKVTWHGPGQLVAYPVVRMRERLGVVDFVRALEGIIISTAAEFGVTGFRIPGRAGVWADSKLAFPEKFAQVGIHVSNKIVTHGLALNCSNDLAPFGGFVPCGITDAGVTTLSRLSGRTITPADAAPVLAVHLAAALEQVAE